ncbi:unnamed protein product [Allacma fusca]|uniref:Uncharacterized protein n=1 Tax=Allacma fusca TaxID=39272 RepID=A0A8J2PSQ1_9HEXA|nr:unnamed protein product [Allacma fusca]
MYAYYALRALKYKIPRKLSMLLTTLQIFQMFFYLYVNGYSFYKIGQGLPCRPVAVHEASSAFQGAQPAQYVRPARHDIQKRSSKRGEDSDEVESTRSMYNKFLRFRAKKKKQGYTADEIKAKFIQEKNLTSKQIADMEPFFIASGRRGRRGAESYIVRIGASRRSFDSERRPSKYDQSLRIFQGQ